MDKQTKPTHAKPSLYAYYFENLKVIARGYGYNLVLHGSLNRDLDMVAIPWQKDIGDHDLMIKEFCTVLGGRPMLQDDESRYCFPHGRMSYVINLNRGEYTHPDFHDPQYYLDISVIPTPDQYNKHIYDLGTGTMEQSARTLVDDSLNDSGHCA